MNGWPTTSRCGCNIPSCSSDGRRPEVDDAITTSGPAALAAAASTDRLRSMRSGALSWTKSTPVAASSAEPTKVSVPSGGSGAMVSRRAGAAGVVEELADLARRLGVGVEEPDVDPVEQEPSGPAATDDTATEQPDGLQARDRAHDAPLTALRSRPLGPFARSARSLGRGQLQLRADVRGLEDAHVHGLQDGDGPAHEVGVGGQLAAAGVEVVLQTRRARCRRPGRPWRRRGAACG